MLVIAKTFMLSKFTFAKHFYSLYKVLSKNKKKFVFYIENVI